MELLGARAPAVIFVTAHDEFAVQAFQIHAVDYLLKPVEPARLQQALQRARESIRKLRRSAVVNIWVDPREYAPGTKNQTMYK